MAVAKVTLNGNVIVDMTDATAANSSILSGDTAYIATGAKTTGNIQSKAGANYYPSTSDQSISTGQYLSGPQTFKAVTVTNLTAENIKSGVTVEVGDSADSDRVKSVTGTYSGMNALVDTKTVTASNRPSSLSFTSMKGQPIAWCLKATFTMTSSSSTYYYVDSMRGNGTNVQGRCFQMGSTRQTIHVTSGYNGTYSGTTFTVESLGNRTTSPGCFYNGSYELVYVYRGS